jgi:pimeloyl-ACP methyl ester carboxylesterase
VAAGFRVVAAARLGRGELPRRAYFHEVDRGGHFAAWEEPELFATEIRAAFSPLR